MHPKKVLLIDDDASHLASCRKALCELGYGVLQAATLDEADRILRIGGHPFLTLVELDVAGGEGTDICGLVKEKGQSPVVVTSRTHKKESTLRRIAEDLHVDGHLLRPFGPAALLRWMDEHLDATPSRTSAEEPGPSSRTSDPEGVRGLLREALAEIPPVEAMSGSPLSLALGAMAREGRSGLLLARSGMAKAVFHLEDGVPDYARTNLPRFRLSSILVDECGLRTEQIREAREMSRDFEGARWLEEILLGLGHIDREALLRAVSSQVESLLRHFLSLRTVHWHFVEAEIPVPAGACARIDLARLLFASIREVRDPDALREHLPDPRTLLKRSPRWQEEADTLGLSAYEREVLALVDGNRTLQEVCGLGRRVVGTIEPTVLAFLGAGLVLLSSRERQSLPSPSAAPLTTSELEGSLQDWPVPLVLADLARRRQTGVLSLHGRTHRKWVFFREGEIVFARSTNPADRIGRVLVEADLVREAEVERAAGESGPRRARRIGGVLMDRGLVSFEQLYWAGIFQVRKIVSSLFPWEEGTWSFRRGALPSYAAAAPALDTREILATGLRGCPAEALETHLTLEGSTLVRPSSREAPTGEPSSLDAVEEALVAWVDEPIAVDDLLEVGLGDRGEVLRALRVLLGIGLLETGSA